MVPTSEQNALTCCTATVYIRYISDTIESYPEKGSKPLEIKELGYYRLKGQYKPFLIDENGIKKVQLYRDIDCTNRKMFLVFLRKGKLVAMRDTRREEKYKS